MPCFQSQFQFLIGKILTIAGFNLFSYESMFQFLIGKILTIREK